MPKYTMITLNMHYTFNICQSVRFAYILLSTLFIVGTREVDENSGSTPAWAYVRQLFTPKITPHTNTDSNCMQPNVQRISSRKKQRKRRTRIQTSKAAMCVRLLVLYNTYMC